MTRLDSQWARRASGLCVGIIASLAMFSIATAQTAPTAEQLQIFQGLTPEQQQAVLQQVGAPQRGATAAIAADRQADVRADNDRRRTAAADDEPLIPVLGPGDTLVIEIAVPRAPIAGQPAPADQVASERRQRLLTDMDSPGRRKLDELIALVLSRNPYELNRDAQLNLPGVAPIALGGLTEEQAIQRLSLEPVLLPLEVQISRLPLAKTGIARLEAFGYDLFDNAPSTFSPLTDVPVPADYVIGPGDVLNVQLFGGQNRSLPLVVSRDGTVNFPELGPIRVGGMTFNAARGTIESRVARQMIGVQASIAMGDTRAIRVFVMGEAKVPGSYTVSGLATMITALFASGGVNGIGSLRDIQLKRQGEVIRRFDLYDILIHGDTSNDAKLLPGDVIFIPPVGDTVSVEGEVKRPAVYELKGESQVDEVVLMAGGYTPEADISRASLTRIDASNRRVVLDVNLTLPVGRGLAPRNGDVLRVARLRPQVDIGVTLEGFVHRPGAFSWREGLRLTDVIGSIDELRPGADQHYILIRRESGPDRRVSAQSADLTAALAAPGSAADVVLAPRDRITVFDLAPGRERIIQPLIDELKLQSDLARPTEIVRVGGSVKVPGEYPLEPGMRIADLLRAGGNLDSAAYGGVAELTRYSVSASGVRQTELIEVDLGAARLGDVSANVSLKPFDYLLVKETPDWTDQGSVTLRGEVRFPGTYPVRKGETLLQVVGRAGGLTSLAFPEGAVFMRRDLKVLEQEQMDRLADRLRADLAALSLQAANAGQSNASEALRAGQSLLSQLQGAKATGRFLIDLPSILASVPGSDRDVALRNGDELVIPRMRQEVTVIGEVQNAASHQFLPQLKRGDYISMSGGITKKADKRRVYVVQADGRTATRTGSLLTRHNDAAIKPGDTIVVPLDTERMPRLPFWQAVSQILYNVAVSVAAVNSF